MAAQHTSVASSANGGVVTGECVATRMITQSWSKRRVRDTTVAERSILRGEGVSTGLYAQCISERRRVNEAKVTDGSEIIYERVAAGVDAQGLCDWRTSETQITSDPMLTNEGVAACLDTLSVAELNTLFNTAQKYNSKGDKKYRLAERHIAAVEQNKYILV